MSIYESTDCDRIQNEVIHAPNPARYRLGVSTGGLRDSKQISTLSGSESLAPPARSVREEICIRGTLCTQIVSGLVIIISLATEEALSFKYLFIISL